jgi:acyl-[acyl-carrier-protein] desaturase
MAFETPVREAGETALQGRMYRLYAGFFDKAERERRWNPFRDIPWDKVAEDVPEALCLNAETFLCVEAYLPDYASNHLQVVREVFGQTWFAANWAYEESKHSLVLMEYLLRSGRRSQEQVFDLHQRLMGARWELPFPTPRMMTIYGCFQEQATFVIYCKQEAFAQKCGDEALRTIFRLIARDEIAHARFYEDVIRVHLELDRAGTLRDIAHVAKHFQMPGVGIVPDYEARIAVMRDEGEIDRDVFLQKVYFPVLKYLGVERAELVRVLAEDRRARAAQGHQGPQGHTEPLPLRVGDSP